MEITIKYESSWKNSFLDGDNNSPLPKKGRNYIGSIAKLKKEGNFIRREVTLDTVMGILNRLIGDQRKLYQSRSSENYYFKGLEEKISFEDNQEVVSNELVFLRNMNGSYDQNSFIGSVNGDTPAFTSKVGQKLWGVLMSPLEDLINFIVEEKFPPSVKTGPLEICGRFEEVKKIKGIKVEDCPTLLKALERKFEGVNFLDKKGEKVIVGSLYTSALYLGIKLLGVEGFTELLSKNGRIPGVSNRTFTKKDFLKKFTGGQKQIWGNPYYRETFVEGNGKVKELLKKASGELIIKLDLDSTQASELNQLIENAGVTSFYLGKKGLAWVSKTRR